MKIVRKSVKVDEFVTEARYFAETDDGFDGAAQGYGYRSVAKLQKAYWYYKNRHKIQNTKNEARSFLKQNPEVARVLREYFSEGNLLWAAKDGERLSMRSLIEELKMGSWSANGMEVVAKLEQCKHLWKSLERDIE